MLRPFSSTSTSTSTHDVRDWKVRNRADDSTVGTVEETLIDDRGRTRHLVVRLEDGRRILVPTGYAEGSRSDRTVWLSGIGSGTFHRLPEYGNDPSAIDEDYERRLATAYDESAEERGYYDRPEYVTDWGHGTGATESGTLARLDTLKDYKVASHDHDPRGWKAVGGDNEELGAIDHLVGDTGAMKVRYLVLKLDRRFEAGDRHILVPAGHASLEPEAKLVRVDPLDRHRVLDAPEWSGDAVGRDHERRLAGFFREGYAGDRRYRHPAHRDDRLYGAR